MLVRTYRIMATQAVYNEISLPGYPGAGVFKNHYLQRHMTVIPAVTDSGVAAAMPPTLRSLDAGERETILQYTQAEALFIIIDDRQGSAYCRDNRIPYVNALLIVRILFLAGKMTEIDYHTLSSAVIEQGRYSPRIIRYGHGCSKQSLAYFMP